MRIDVDGAAKGDWNRELMRFADATIYQTWEYGEARWGARNISHIAVRHEDEVRSMAQVTIVRLPVVGRGIAYVFHGPLWRKSAHGDNREFLEIILRALKEEYVDKRNFIPQSRSQ